jgi:starvation-inducible DNA-binding protein
MNGKPNTETLIQNVAEQNAQNLAQILANTYVAYVKTQNFHWNLIDPRFHSLHLLFEQYYEELAKATDELAERIRMLKIRSPGSMKEFLQLATLDESESTLTGDKMIKELCQDREMLIKQLNQKIEEASRSGDEGTADLLIQHLRMHEKAAWMLRSHLS